MGSIRKLWLPFCSVLLMSTLIADTTGLLIKRSTDDQNVQASSGTQGCGYSNRQNSADLPNKYATAIGEFPWIVEIIHNGANIHLTLGALIHPRVVVSSAYYIRPFPVEKFTIRAGAWSNSSLAQERSVEYIKAREDFIEERAAVGNDLGLIRLTAPFDITPAVNVIGLPNQDESFDNYKDCRTFEWGEDRLANTDQKVMVLLKLDLDMLTTSTCNQRLQATELGPQFTMHETVQCAAKEGTNLCQGDLGAPLVCPIGDNRYKLTGLATGGVGCNGTPGLYTRVSSFRQWIDNLVTEWGLETAC